MKNILRIISISFNATISSLFSSQIAMPDTISQPQHANPGPNSSKECHHPALRTTFSRTDCEVRAYPSHGGIVLEHFTAAELTWLGLSRSQTSYRSQDPQAEDEFAFQMLRLGAYWWKSEWFHDKRSSDVQGGYPWPDSYPPSLRIGYPSTGGVWVLKVRNGYSWPDEWAKVRMAFTMDERCAALEELGATFYKNVDDCPDIAKSLEDGVAIGKRWEERMKEIDE